MAKNENRLHTFGTGKIVVAAVERAVTNRWDQALERAAATEGTLEERVGQVRRSFRRELVAIGAASGGTAAIPAVGTMTAIGLTTTELAWTAARTADMILTVAAIHGHTDTTAPMRKAWVLSILAFDDDAAEGLGRTIAELGGTVTASRSVTLEVLDRVNSRVGKKIIARYGASRSAVLFGRVLPFGIGAVIGGGANHVLVGTIIRRADLLFAEISRWNALPPPQPALAAAPTMPALPPPPRMPPPPLPAAPA